MPWHTLSQPALALAVSLGSFLLAGNSLAAGACTPEWSEAFPSGSFSSSVRCVEVIAASDGEPILYVGGSFRHAGGVLVNRIARWRGGTWESLGSGIVTPNSGTVWAIEAYGSDGKRGGDVYAGGAFSGVEPSMQGIQRWSGTAWESVGGGVAGSVRDLVVFDDGAGVPSLFACGDFLDAGGTRVNRIARWDGTSWSEVGGGLNDSAYKLLVVTTGSQSQLLVAGSFTEAGNQPAVGMARWNGRSWSAVGDLASASIRDIELDAKEQGSLIACGLVDLADGHGLVGRVIQLIDNGWIALGGTLKAIPHAVEWHDSGNGSGPRLFVGGAFTIIDGQPAARLARWDSDHWTAIPVGTSGSVQVLRSVPSDDRKTAQLWIGGSFQTDEDDPTPAKFLTLWDGEQLVPAGNGLAKADLHYSVQAGGFVLALLEVQQTPGLTDGLYVAGDFAFAGQAPVQDVARWDGESWSPVGDGPGGATLDLAVFDDGAGSALYAAGLPDPWSRPRDNTVLSRWDGKEWTPLLGGYMAEALAVFDDGTGLGARLFVGGAILDTGESSLAIWNGRDISAVNPGPSGYVRALWVHDEGLGDGPALFAGGEFWSVAGQQIWGIARWDGTSWSALGQGLPPGFGPARVYAITSYDDGSGFAPELYIGGQFAQAGDVAASNIAKWNGRRWAALVPEGAPTSSCPGVCGTVFALHVHDDGRGPALFVGGRFVNAGGVAVRHIARWDGVSWSGLGTGLANPYDEGFDDEFVFALGAYAPNADESRSLFVGGQFVTAGGRSSGNIAQWSSCGPGSSAADLDGDGFVGPLDLALLLTAWGDCPSVGACAADLNGDGEIDGFDLAILLAAWG